MRRLRGSRSYQISANTLYLSCFEILNHFTVFMNIKTERFNIYLGTQLKCKIDKIQTTNANLL